MALATLLSVISLFLLASAQTPSNAPAVENNPRMVTYQAILQASKPVQGTITGVSAQNGTGVDFNVNFFSFPDPSIGPYAYHIHVNPVPEDGNCTATGGHLDPYNVTDAYKCPPEQPYTCQVGDLAGKHGKIDTTPLPTPSYMTQYSDIFLSTVPDTTAFFGNRSVVVHAANGTRLNCGNFILQSGNSGSGNGSSNGSYTGSSPTTSATATASASDSGAMPTQSTEGSTGGAGINTWSSTTFLAMGFMAVMMVAM